MFICMPLERHTSILIVDTPVGHASLLHLERGDCPEYTSMPPYKEHMRN
jgi:hypothetical protein